MSFSPVRGRSSTRRVAAHEAVVLAVEVEPDARPALVQLDLADVADPHARHAHGLPLPGRHALGVLELDPDVPGPVLDEREAEALLREDVGAHAHAEDEQAEHCEEVAEVSADAHRFMA